MELGEGGGENERKGNKRRKRSRGRMGVNEISFL
jgi:hypothetical protein